MLKETKDTKYSLWFKNDNSLYRKGFVPFVSLSSVCEHVHFCEICISAHIYDLTDCLLRKD